MGIEEILKKMGYSEEDITKIVEAMNTNKIYTTSEENIDQRYIKLKGEYETLKGEHENATSTLEDLKNNKDVSEEVEKKIKNYEVEIENLKTASLETKKEFALKEKLMAANVKDIDYIAYKFKNEKELELDDKGNIIGIDDALEELKVKYPLQFESPTEEQVQGVKLPLGNNSSNGDEEVKSLSDALKIKYMNKEN